MRRPGVLADGLGDRYRVAEAELGQPGDGEHAPPRPGAMRRSCLLARDAPTVRWSPRRCTRVSARGAWPRARRYGHRTDRVGSFHTSNTRRPAPEIQLSTTQRLAPRLLSNPHNKFAIPSRA